MKTYPLRYTCPKTGKRKRETFLSARERQAFKLSLEDQRTRQRHGGKPVLTFGELLERYFVEHAEVEKAKTSAEEDKRIARLYFDDALRRTLIELLCKDDLVKLRTELAQRATRRGKLLSAKTVNNALIFAKKVMNFAVEKDLIPSSPWNGVKPLKGVRPGFAFWTLDERERFLRFCKSPDLELWRIVTVAVHTGMRLGELAALRRGCIDFEAGFIRVEAVYSAKLKEEFQRTKNYEARTIPMGHAVASALQDMRLAGSSELVFRRGMFSDLYHRFQRMQVRADVKRLRFHDLRHTFASTLVMAGVPLYTVRQLLGHKTSEMTERYSHLAPDTLRQAVDKIAAQGVQEQSSPNAGLAAGQEKKQESETVREEWRSRQGSNLARIIL